MTNVSNILKNEGKTCIGCEACSNICKYNAINLTVNDEGFPQAVVNNLCTGCGNCLNVCPLHQTPKENSPDPPCYAFQATDEERKFSSSGAVFPRLSKYVLSKGGYVAGPIFDKKFELRYILTDDPKKIESMKGSKYVFSYMGEIYSKIKAKTKNKKLVLFVGCPCQVAALRNYVGNSDYLITVDLLCGGLPSPELFKNYIHSSSNANQIKDIKFRDKRYPYGTLVIGYDDGTEQVSYRDPYYEAFLLDITKMIQCSKCQYANTPRVGDLTIGDFWQIEKIIPSASVNEGVNCILLNTQKGKEIFNEIKNNNKLLVEVPLEFIKRYNRFNVERPAHLARPRLFYMLSKHTPVKKALEYSIHWKYDLGITGFWRVINFGGVLSYYALFHLLEDDLRQECVMIEARFADKGCPPSPSLLPAAYPYYTKAPYYGNVLKQKELNNRVNAFIVGSDQVWNRELIPQSNIECYTLDFVEDWKKKIAIAASFGNPSFVGNEDEKKRFISLLKRFNHISVRENTGKEYCESLGLKAKVLLDPILLCDIVHLNKLTKKEEYVWPERYIFNYTVHPEHFENMERLFGKIGIGPITIVGAECDLKLKYPFPVTKASSVVQWLNCLTNSEMVVTDSFHAITMALRFKKQFIVIYPGTVGIDRVYTLLKKINLEDRIFSNIAEAADSNIWQKPIDYAAITPRLDELRLDSITWIKTALDLK